MSVLATADRPAADAGIRRTWRESSPAARALLVGVFVNKLGAFLMIFLVLFLTYRGFSSVQAGLALGAFSAGSVVGVLAGGTLTDRLGPRRTILISMTGSAALLLTVLYLHSYPALLVAVTVVGAVGQAYRPASASLLSELTPAHQQVMIFAMYRLALNLGTTAAPLIGIALVSVSYNLLFWGEAATALAYALIAMVALPGRSGALPGPAAGGPAAGGLGRAGPATVRPSYLAVLGDRRFVLFLFAMLVNATVYVQYLVTLPLAVRAAGLAITVYAVLVALNGLIVITCELLVTTVVQRWPARIVVAIGFALLGGGLASYALPWGVTAFVLGTLIWSLAEIVGGPTMFAYPAQAAPGPLRGRYLGATHAMYGLGSAIGPVLGVAVWDAAGTGLWLACGAVALLALLAAVFGIRPELARSANLAPPDRTPPDHATDHTRTEDVPCSATP